MMKNFLGSMTMVNRQNEFKFSKKISPFEMIIQKNDFKISKSQSQWFSPVTFTIIKITCNSLKIFIFTLKVKKIIYFYQCFFRNRNIIRKSNSLVYLSVNTRNRVVNSLLKKTWLWLRQKNTNLISLNFISGG